MGLETADSSMGTDRVEQWQIRKPAVVTDRGVVTSQHWQAATVGADALRDGGNAVDAAVATALALQCCEPWMSGLAASGYMLVGERSGAVMVVEFTGQCPLSIDPACYPLDPAGGTSFLGFPRVQNDRNVVGWEAVCVPGAVAGLSAALDRWGRLGWDRVLAPAIDMADRGIGIDWHATLAIALAHADLVRDPAAKGVFLPGGSPPAPGTRLANPSLARTLRTLAEAGPDAFYTGVIAGCLLDDLRAGGSAIAEEDLAGYRASIHAPDWGTHGPARIAVAPHTSGGRRLLDALGALEGVQPTPEGFVAIAAALQSAFARHGDLMRAPSPEGGSTTQVNAVDADGMLVSLTFTLLNRFGARVMSPSTGILLNNGMAWFDPHPDRRNSLHGGRRAPNNMCPVIAQHRDGDPWFALGASGGNQIVPALTQIVTFLVDAGMDLDGAMHHPRLDTGPSAKVRAQPDLGEPALAALRQAYEVVETHPTVFPRLYASPSAIVLAPDGRRHALAEIGYPSAGMAAG